MKSKAEMADESTERAVSPVIGVILMVAITVILAAVIAAFVLDLGQSSGANPSAAYTIDNDSDAGEYVVQISAIDRLDSYEVRCPDGGPVEGAGEVGNTTTIDNDDCGYDEGNITIVGEYEGNEATL